MIALITGTLSLQFLQKLSILHSSASLIFFPRAHHLETSLPTCITLTRTIVCYPLTSLCVICVCLFGVGDPVLVMSSGIPFYFFLLCRLLGLVHVAFSFSPNDMSGLPIEGRHLFAETSFMIYYFILAVTTINSAREREQIERQRTSIQILPCPTMEAISL